MQLEEWNLQILQPCGKSRFQDTWKCLLHGTNNCQFFMVLMWLTIKTCWQRQKQLWKILSRNGCSLTRDTLPTRCFQRRKLWWLLHSPSLQTSMMTTMMMWWQQGHIHFSQTLQDTFLCWSTSPIYWWMWRTVWTIPWTQGKSQPADEDRYIFPY